eukprot:TRINITY_DN6490_c0_g1_i1.p1 TRINITY_DN6490_c0_g1~~TRINITY_DN6490_c0_g1_i1.p1  ORF type:complete len:1027 (+),score=131.90 TRINITY_DN6490_c0_g1_i1:49-3129(+)
MLAVLSLLSFGFIDIRMLVMTEQPIQPYNPKWMSPCGNASEGSCLGGYPFISAAMRRAGEGVHGAVTIADFTQVAKLIQGHSLKFAINDKLWKRAGVDLVKLGSPYFFSWSSYVEDVVYALKTNLMLVESNLNPDTSLFHGLAERFGVVEPYPGTRIGVVVIYPKGYFFNTYSLHPTVTDLVSVIRFGYNVSAVIAVAASDISQVELDSIHLTGVDALLYPAGVTSEQTPPPVAPFRNGSMWFVQTRASFASMNGAVLRFENNKLIAIHGVTNVVPDTMPPEYRDSNFAADQTFLQDFIDEVERQDVVLGSTTTDMPHGHIKFQNGTRYDSCRHEECHLGTLISDAMLHARGAEIALVNGGSLREGWKVGNVTRSTMENSFPFKNNLCHLNMTAAWLWRTLEVGLSSVTAKGGYDRNAPVSGQFLQTAGLRYTFDPSRAIGSRVISMQVREGGRKDTKWVDIDSMQSYSVVTSKFICTGGDNFNMRPVQGTKKDVNGVDLWSIIAVHLKALSPYTPFLVGVIEMEANASKPSLMLAKTADNCTLYQRYVAAYEHCEPCYAGFYHPDPGEGPCMLIPGSTPPANPLPVVLPVVFVILAGMTVIIVALRVRQKGVLKKLNKHAPREGVISIVFTDIQSSSSLWGQFPEEMDVALTTHHKIFRELIERYEGYEVKTIGDAFMIAFKSQVNAISFLCSLQLELLTAEWPARLKHHPACLTEKGFKGLRVRAGLHVGRPVVKRTPQGGYDYEGSMVNECARVSDSGAGGQLVLTEESYQALETFMDDLPYELDIRYLGEYMFKGISRPIGCYQILPEELTAREYGPLRNADRVADVLDAREYGPLRNADRVADVLDVESGGKSGSAMSLSTDNTEVDQGAKKEWVTSMQVLRRHVISFGFNGIPVDFVSALICHSMDTNAVQDDLIIYKLIFACIKQQNSTAPAGEGGYTARNSIISDNQTPVHSAHARKSLGVWSLKWGSLVPIFNVLPKQCIVAMARKLQGEPLNAALACKYDYRSRASVPELTAIVGV